jgi:hypothetical protein
MSSFSLHFSLNVLGDKLIKASELVRHVARMAREKTAYRVLVAKPKGKRSFGRPRRGWEDNKETGLIWFGTEDKW